MKVLSLFLFFIFLLLIPSSAVEITTNARLIDGVYYVMQGEKVEVLISGEPSQELSISIKYLFSMPSQDGTYLYSQKKFPIPVSAKFEVKAYPVYNITVEAKLWIFTKKLEANARDDVAKVSADVPSGNYDVKIYGNAKGEIVNLEANAFAKIKLGSDGNYRIEYDTSKLPLGEMSVRADSKELKVKVVSSLPAPTVQTPVPTPIPTPTPTPTPMPTPEPTPTPTPAPTSTPTLTEAGWILIKEGLYLVSFSYQLEDMKLKITGRFVNFNDSELSGDVWLYVEGERKVSRTVTIKPGENEVWLFTYEFSSPGRYRISIGNETQCLQTAEVQLEPEKARIILKKRSVSPLEEIDIIGENFSGSVSIWICSQECYELGKCQSQNGTFECSIRIPKISEGKYFLKAEDSHGRSAEEMIEVLEKKVPGFEALAAVLAFLIALRRFS